MVNLEEKETMGVQELITNIKENLSQKSASSRDEVRVMKAMLNDRDFKVSTYSNSRKGFFSWSRHSCRLSGSRSSPR